MKRFIEHDSFTGLSRYYEYVDGKVLIRTEGDAEGNLEYSKAIRNDTDISKQGIKKGIWHVAHWPPSVQLEMMTKFGVDPISNPKEAIKIAKVHYPYCLCVEKKQLGG